MPPPLSDSKSVFFSQPLSESQEDYSCFVSSLMETPGRVCAMLAAAPPHKNRHRQPGPTSVPLRLHPPHQPRTPIIFPGKQPEITTHTGLKFGRFIETAAPVIIFQKLWISAGWWGALHSRGETGLVVLVWGAELWLGKELKAQTVLHEAPVVYNKSKVYFLYGLAHRG